MCPCPSCLGLLGAINWFVLNVGLADPQDQEAELFGTGGGKKAVEASAASAAETNKEAKGLNSEDKKEK